MNDLITVCGMDPAQRNWAVVSGTYNIRTKEIIITKRDLITTKANKDKYMKKSSKDFFDSVHINYEVNGLIDLDTPIFAEIPNGSLQSRGAVGNGIVFGILGSLVNQGYIVLQLSQLELKKATINLNNPKGKNLMIAFMRERHPDIGWYNVLKKDEHIADAIAAIYAGVVLPEFKLYLDKVKIIMNHQNKIEGGETTIDINEPIIKAAVIKYIKDTYQADVSDIEFRMARKGDDRLSATAVVTPHVPSTSSAVDELEEEREYANTASQVGLEEEHRRSVGIEEFTDISDKDEEEPYDPMKPDEDFDEIPETPNSHENDEEKDSRNEENLDIDFFS